MIQIKKTQPGLSLSGFQVSKEADKLIADNADNTIGFRINQNIVIIDFIPLLFAVRSRQAMFFVFDFIAITPIMLRHHIARLPSELLQAFDPAFFTHTAFIMLPLIIFTEFTAFLAMPMTAIHL